MRVLGDWRRKARWLAGRGWASEDFAARYATGSADAWGYRGSPQHERRADWILAALPRPRFANALEVGCAQGFLTERLAARADRLVACDISAAAIAQAETRGGAHVEHRVADIRDGFPGEGFDLCLFSDVLYYLSPRETDAVLAEAADRIVAGGFLVVANEWRAGAKGLTPPAHAFARLDAAAAWKRESDSRRPLGEAVLSIAVYQRMNAR